MVSFIHKLKLNNLKNQKEKNKNKFITCQAIPISHTFLLINNILASLDLTTFVEDTSGADVKCDDD